MFALLRTPARRFSAVLGLLVISQWADVKVPLVGIRLREDASARQVAQRPMTFLDMQLIRQVSSPAPSPDGKWLLYTLSTPDWKQAKRYTDVYLVSTQQGVPSTRQMTFTKEKNETSPLWSRDGKFFVFLSNREAP